MNIKQKIRNIADASRMGRRLGKTTAIVNAAKQLDGLVLGATHDHALRIKRKHGIKARSIELDLDGFCGPFFIDHYALENLLYKAANKIESLEKQLEENEKNSN